MPQVLNTGMHIHPSLKASKAWFATHRATLYLEGKKPNTFLFVRQDNRPPRKISAIYWETMKLILLSDQNTQW